MEIPDRLYRYEDSHGKLVLLDYYVKRATRTGVWIAHIWSPKGEKFVSLYSRKRFAYPTPEAALIGYIKRTERHIMLAKQNTLFKQEALSRAIIKREEMNNANN